MLCHEPMRLCVLSLVAACASPPADTVTPPTIDQGVFGQIHNGCDTPDCQGSETVGAFVDLFPTTPALGVVATGYEENTVSDTHGSYELSAAVGSHAICVGNEPAGGGFVPTSCATIEVKATTVTRIDYAYGPGGGRWYMP